MKIFKSYLSFLPMCLGLYHVFIAKHDLSTYNGVFMVIIGLFLTINYGYNFSKWLYSKLFPIINKNN